MNRSLIIALIIGGCFLTGWTLSSTTDRRFAPAKPGGCSAATVLSQIAIFNGKKIQQVAKRMGDPAPISNDSLMWYNGYNTALGHYTTEFLRISKACQ